MPDEVLEQVTGTEQIPANESATGVVDTATEQQGAPDATEKEAETDDQKNERVQREVAERQEKKARGVQKRMGELTREKHDERRRADELAAQNARLLEAVLGSKKPADAESTEGEPNPSAYTDYNEYTRDLAKYHATQAAQAIVQKTTKESGEASQREAAARAENAAATLYATRAREAAKALPDYAEVMEDAADVSIPPSVLSMIRRMEDGPVIAYHMVKNPQLASQFFTQPADMHGILLGQISATIKAPAKVSNAPPPGRTVQAKPGSGSEPPLDPDAYMAWAAKNMR